MSIELAMPSNHLILCPPLLLLPSTLPNIRAFCNESVLIRWPKYWSFSFSTEQDWSPADLGGHSFDPVTVTRPEKRGRWWIQILELAEVVTEWKRRDEEGPRVPCSSQLTWPHPLLPSPAAPGPKQSFPGQLHKHQARLLLLSSSPKKGSIPNQRGQEPVWSSSRNQRALFPFILGVPAHGGLVWSSPLSPMGTTLPLPKLQGALPSITGPTIPALCSS